MSNQDSTLFIPRPHKLVFGNGNVGDAALEQSPTGANVIRLDGSLEVLGSVSAVGIGKVLHVDGTNGSDSNDGLSWSNPLATIGAAIALASGRGDYIFVTQGDYAENLVVEDMQDLTIACATPVGRGITYNARPNIAPDEGIALVIKQSRRCMFVGLYFYSTDSAAVKLDGEGCSFINCESSSDTAEEYKLICDNHKDFTGSGTTWKGCILDSGVNGIKNYVRTVADAEGQATNCVIEDCDFYGHSGADIAGEAADNVLFDGWRITGNRFMTKDKSVYLAMTGAGADASTNVLIADNFFANDGALNTTKIAIPAGAAFVGNYNAIGVVNGSSF